MLKFVIVLLLILSWSIAIPFLLWADYQSQDWFLFAVDVILAIIGGDWLIRKFKEVHNDW